MGKALLNFIRGVGSLVEIIPTARPQYRYRARYQPRTDAEAIASDWAIVGDDLRKAMGSLPRNPEARDERSVVR